MPIFIERVVLPVAAALIVMLLVTNPMNFDKTQRITAGIAIVFAAWFLSHTLQLHNEATKAKTAPPAIPPETEVPLVTHASGQATSSGANSPANTGDGNTFVYGDQQNVRNKEPKKVEPKP